MTTLLTLQCSMMWWDGRGYSEYCAVDLVNAMAVTTLNTVPVEQVKAMAVDLVKTVVVSQTVSAISWWLDLIASRLCKIALLHTN